jgi:paraquat-inducible protein B
MIGGFVVMALVLCTAAVFVFGSGDFFKQTNSYVLFFEDSIKGLSTGAPVSFRGVDIGTVKDIRLLADLNKITTHIPVIIEIDPSRWDTTGIDELFKTEKERFEALISKGLRAKLDLQSIVTGKYMVSLDFYPDEPVQYKGVMPDLTEIPTTRGKLNKLADSLQHLPFEELFNSILSTVQGLDRMVNSKEAAALLPNMNSIADRVNALVDDIDKMVPAYEALAVNTDQEVMRLGRQLEGTVAEYKTLAQTVTAEIRPLSQDLRETAGNISQGIKNAKTLMKKADGVLDKGSPIMTDLTKTLKELSLAARSIRVWADYLERHPEAFIRGKGEYRR